MLPIELELLVQGSGHTCRLVLDDRGRMNFTASRSIGVLNNHPRGHVVAVGDVELDDIVRRFDELRLA